MRAAVRAVMAAIVDLPLILLAAIVLHRDGLGEDADR